MPVDNEMNGRTNNHTAEIFKRCIGLKLNFYGNTQLIPSFKLL